MFLVAQEKSNITGTHNSTHSLTGYLVDRNCGKGMVMANAAKSDAKAAWHTKDCSLDDACKAHGFGIVTGGKFYKFDDAGDKKALAYLNSTKKEDNIKVDVFGTIDGDTIRVASIRDLQPPATHGRKKK
jgi:hypothetical protein